MRTLIGRYSALILFCAISALTSRPPFAIQQLGAQTYYEDGGAPYDGEEYVDEPTVCWTSTMYFHDPRAYPYFEHDGYFFDANPFILTRWLEGNTAGIFRPQKGRYISDVTGKYVWSDAHIRVNCRVRRYWWGYNQPYAVVTAQLGSVSRLSCNENDSRVRYAEYDPYADDGGNCSSDGSGGGGTGSGIQYYPGDYTGGETVHWGTGIGNGGTSACGSEARVEYVCIDYWDGRQWVEWSCGYATTC
jgi:hypothetical protein